MMERTAAILSLEHLPEGQVDRRLRGLHQARRGGRRGRRLHGPVRRCSEFLDGRKLRFDVEVTEGDRTIGVGTHERRVIDLGRRRA